MNEQANKGRSARQIGFRLLLILIALSPLAYSIYREWPDFQKALQAAEWGTYLIGQLLLIPIMFLIGIVPWVSLRNLEEAFSLWKAGGIYFFTQLFKYLPGGFWAMPGRMGVYRFFGVGGAKSIVSVLREMFAIFLGGAVIALLGLLQGVSIEGPLGLTFGIGILIITVGLVLIQLPWFWRLLPSIPWLRDSSLAAFTSLEGKYINLRWLPRALLVSMSFWFLFGLPFRQLAIAIYPQAEVLSWLEASSIFALAWCVGAAVIFIPAGIGVREGVLTLLMTEVMPPGPALSLALLARLAWLIAEGCWILLSLVWIYRSSDVSWEGLKRMGGSRQGE